MENSLSSIIGLNNPKIIRWRLGVFAALGMALLSLVPQASLLIARGGQWNGSYAYVDTDETAYSAYLSALIAGRPRRNDPYTGRDDEAQVKQPESLFSVQFVPAYIVAIPARALRVSASTGFIILMPLVAFASSLAIFWLLLLLMRDERAAAAGALFVLCLGTLASGQGTARAITGLEAGYGYLPFLRRYVPSVAFPLSFVMYGLIWRALTSTNWRARFSSAAAAGLIFALLIFSYFYLWTAAAAWLACLMLMCLLARPKNWQHGFLSLCLVAVLGATFLIPYFFMLARRAPTLDTVQALTPSRLPDLWRVPELIGILILIALATRRGLIKWNDYAVIFAASCALVPLAVFNQQIVTGFSLQPIHYEQFISNYVVLVGAFLTFPHWWRKSSSGGAERAISQRVLLCVALFAFSWGIIETMGNIRGLLKYNIKRDEIAPVIQRLAELESDRQRITLIRGPQEADSVPTLAQASVLWSPHMQVFSGVTLDEHKERFYQYLYYTGVDERGLARALTAKNFTVRLALFGWERANERLAVEVKPITEEQEAEEVRLYTDYITSFTRERAARYTLSYVIAAAEDEPHLKNLDRWYMRDEGERMGRFTIYRLHLK
jgi:hypothetical protein